MTGDRDIPASFITAIQAVIREAQYHGSSNTWSLPKDVLSTLARETSALHGADPSPCRVLSISSRICSKGTKGCEVFDHEVRNLPTPAEQANAHMLFGGSSNLHIEDRSNEAKTEWIRGVADPKAKCLTCGEEMGLHFGQPALICPRDHERYLSERSSSKATPGAFALGAKVYMRGSYRQQGTIVAVNESGPDVDHVKVQWDPPCAPAGFAFNRHRDLEPVEAGRPEATPRFPTEHDLAVRGLTSIKCTAEACGKIFLYASNDREQEKRGSSWTGFVRCPCGEKRTLSIGSFREDYPEAQTMKEVPPNYERMAAGGWDGEAVPVVQEVPRPHIVGGEFQSDKYPTCPRGKVPLSTKDKTAQPLLYLYAQIRRAVDAEFADDLEWALEKHGYVPDNDVMKEAEHLVSLWEKKCKAPTPDTGGQIAMSRLAREGLVTILASKLWGLHPLTTTCLGTRPSDSASPDEVQPSEQPCGACGETKAPRGYFWGPRTACLDAKACTKRQKEKKT
jgi:hypothetical protein